MAAANKAQGAPLPAKLASLLREAKWLALVALAGYLALILLTYHKADPGWSHSATVAAVQNAGGRLGPPEPLAVAADLGHQPVHPRLALDLPGGSARPARRPDRHR